MTTPAKPTDSTSRLVMLLVDDDEVFLALAEAHFQQAGFRVISSVNAMDALDAVDKLTDLDCIVSDIWLPKGTPHGVSLASMISMRFPSAVRILVTGDLDARNYVTPSEGFVFNKPVDLAAVTAKIHALRAEAEELAARGTEKGPGAA